MSKTNHLVNSTSPYLLQHQENPVNWYPWGEEAFEQAKADDKPIFLSIGYSTCHWCHVMAHESFEDDEVAALLNEHYICIKVDKEERPDIDSTYMSICVALTGSGGWPMTILMDSSGNPFFAGTYFPKKKHYGMPGLMDILQIIHQKWTSEREGLLESANAIVDHMSQNSATSTQDLPESEALIDQGIAFFEAAFDPKHGGFGRAPKFPSPHNLLFLMNAYQVTKNQNCLAMAEKTLMQIAKGGIFDHIGFGFSRYSTDAKWLVPHFEKMLYDNALLIMAYTKAYELTQNPEYKAIVQKTVDYLMREMTNSEGGFYSAQDADTQGVEGKYYVFTPDEILSLLGTDEGRLFCKLYDITQEGNFEGQSIPNQLHLSTLDNRMADALPVVYEYRKQRYALHKDDKILTSWNALMIAALCDAAIILEQPSYLAMAKAAAGFIEAHLCGGTQVFASFRDGKRTDSGFIDDYAFYIHALLKLYSATLDTTYLSRAQHLTQQTINDFFDSKDGGFYLYANTSEALVLRPKETYDGAIPSGNSVMTMNLIMLSQLVGDEFDRLLEQQIAFMTSQITDQAASSAYFLSALLKKDFPDAKITAVLASPKEKEQVISTLLKKGSVTILDHETDDYKLLNHQTTFYVCEGHVCHPPTNNL